MAADTALAHRHTLAGTDYVPRRNTRTNQIEWINEATVLRGVETGRTYCTGGPNNPPAFISNTDLTEDIEGGVPCAECNARWPLPTTNAKP